MPVDGLKGDYAMRTIVIADDHALVRSGLKAVFQTIASAEIIAEAQNGIEAIAFAKRHKPTLLVLDVAMPLAQGVEVYTEARRWTPETRIAVLTGFRSPGMLADWMSAGVDGLFLKTTPPEEMTAGFSLLLEGGSYVAEEVREILQDLETQSDLTPREREILSLIATGFSNNEIAGRLGVSPKTVDNHRTSLMRKLEVHSVAELVARALRDGLLDHLRQL